MACNQRGRHSTLFEKAHFSINNQFITEPKQSKRFCVAIWIFKNILYNWLMRCLGWLYGKEMDKGWDVDNKHSIQLAKLNMLNIFLLRLSLTIYTLCTLCRLCSLTIINVALSQENVIITPCAFIVSFFPIDHVCYPFAFINEKKFDRKVFINWWDFFCEKLPCCRSSSQLFVLQSMYCPNRKLSLKNNHCIDQMFYQQFYFYPLLFVPRTQAHAPQRNEFCCLFVFLLNLLSERKQCNFVVYE